MITAKAAQDKAQETIKKVKEDWAKTVDRQIKEDVDKGYTRNIKVVLQYNVRDNALLIEFIETYVMEGWTFTTLSDKESDEEYGQRNVTYSVSC